MKNTLQRNPGSTQSAHLGEETWTEGEWGMGSEDRITGLVVAWYLEVHNGETGPLV